MSLCAQKARQTCTLNLPHRIGKVRDHASKGRVKEGLKRTCFRQKTRAGKCVFGVQIVRDEGNGTPLQYSWPGKSHGQRSLIG